MWIAEFFNPTINPQSSVRDSKLLVTGDAGGEAKGSATGGAPIRLWDAGRLHVQEQRAGPAARRELPLALLGVLARLLAVLAPDGKR